MERKHHSVSKQSLLSFEKHAFGDLLSTYGDRQSFISQEFKYCRSLAQLEINLAWKSFYIDLISYRSLRSEKNNCFFEAKPHIAPWPWHPPSKLSPRRSVCQASITEDKIAICYSKFYCSSTKIASRHFEIALIGNLLWSFYWQQSSS